MIDCPVLFLGFNRPDLASIVLGRLRECGVRKLFVALDGPRAGNNSDAHLCAEMKSLIDNIDWVDEKVILNRSVNLGCGRAVSEAITWFFQHVDRGIIVEDDCLPDPSFFTFCEEMLEQHAQDEDVWSVAGTSLIPDALLPAKSHFFSKYVGIWGWATWKRAWEHYDYDLATRTPDEWRNVVRQRSENAVECRYWLHILDLMLDGKIDTWDFQVQFSSWKSNAIHATSSRNLVENLGFRGDATHTKEHSQLAERKSHSSPPPYCTVPIQPDKALDRIIFSEKLNASKELAEWLFDDSSLIQLTKTAAEQKKYIEELEDHLKKRGVIIESLEAARISHLEELKLIKNELASYSGLTGVLKCIKKRIK